MKTHYSFLYAEHCFEWGRRSGHDVVIHAVGWKQQESHQDTVKYDDP